MEIGGGGGKKKKKPRAAVHGPEWSTGTRTQLLLLTRGTGPPGLPPRSSDRFMKT